MLKGFTLIELLVVVLIIGILSAVALPQYQKAVNKTRAMQAFTLLSAIYKAEQVYYMANGTWPTSLDDLDISLPPYQRMSTGETEDLYWYPWGYCSLDKRGGGNVACNIKYTFSHMIIRVVPAQRRFACVTSGAGADSVNDSSREALCKSLGFTKASDGVYEIRL